MGTVSIYVQFMICINVGFANYVTTCSLLVAPSGGPQSLREVETTSTNVTIAWDAVNCIERNQ